MSDRGAFVTEYIYCEQCFEALKPVLCRGWKNLDGFVVPCGDGKGIYPIIAGKVSELYEGGEITMLNVVARGEIEAAICHPITIAVLPECGRYREWLGFSPSTDRLPATAETP
jgi:hypothetical protein